MNNVALYLITPRDELNNLDGEKGPRGDSCFKTFSTESYFVMVTMVYRCGKVWFNIVCKLRENMREMLV